MVNHHICLDCLGTVVLPDPADQGASISRGSQTAIKQDSSGTTDEYQPNPPGDTSGESASSSAKGEDSGSEDTVLDSPDAEVRSRLRLKVIVPLFQPRSNENVPSGRVHFAFDQMYVAASE